MNILRLAPLAQCELAGRRPTFIDQLFDDGFPVAQFRRLDAELIQRVVAGGFPAALARKTSARRAAWYRDYIDTLVQRDVRDLARIRSLEAVPKLLAAAAAQTAQLFNASELAGPFQLSRPTIADYLALLERVFLIDRLPPWHSNRLSRLIKTPKLHLVDTGVACALLGLNVAALHANRVALGPLVETFVYQELRRQATWRDDGIVFSHFRDKDGVEVDMVLERGSSAVAGVEVKASASVTDADFRGLRKLRSAAGKHFKGGVVLYDGETSMPFGDRLFAVPIRAMWEGVRQGKRPSPIPRDGATNQGRLRPLVGRATLHAGGRHLLPHE